MSPAQPGPEFVLAAGGGTTAEPAAYRRLHSFFEIQVARSPFAVAIDAGPGSLTYRELDLAANRLANFIARAGVRGGNRVGILLERSAETYVAVLAILKASCAFVPIDPGYPADRISYIAGDSGIALLVTTSGLSERWRGLGCPVMELDRVRDQIASSPEKPPAVQVREESLAYIIYTSGTTGRPKGVAVSHSNICRFLSVVSPVYGVTERDRVYQGMTIAFDFSIEEIWPTLMAGATLVPGPADARRLGSGLADFLEERGITVLYCVPTLLATLDREIPSIRTLVVGGEPCPRDLVERWSRPGRRMLNTYGPTETTVTATWCELEPGRPVSIGRPLPNYSIYILDEHLLPLSEGQAGEIAIGGPCVARGYLNRPELTAEKFIPDPFAVEAGGRLYRTGDLGRITPNGEIEFLGRIDTQVKIRGYRIELAEIEAVLLEDGAVENAIVAPIGEAGDLAAYVTLRRRESPETVKQRLAAELCRRLPTYMAPAYVEILDSIPMLPSGKADRKSLPAPRSPRLTARAVPFVPPETDRERRLAEAWGRLFGTEVSVEDDFFLDLGGHSLFAARLISELRNDPDLGALSIADLYANPTVRRLAGFVDRTKRPVGRKAGFPRPALRHSTARVWRAGILQFGLLYMLIALFAAPAALIVAARSEAGSAGRIGMLDAAAALGLVLASFLLPLVLKWALIGRFRSGSYPLWGWYYARFWLVNRALEYSPLHMLAGSPLMPLYLRLLGARIGRNCQISTPVIHIPDQVEIGDGVSIGYEVVIEPYVIEDGWLHIAPVRIGSGASVGTRSVVLGGARVGADARVDEQSLVTRQMEIPAGETWAGSPAQPAPADPLLDAMEQVPVSQRFGPALWAAYAAGYAFLQMLPVLSGIPALFVLWAAWNAGGFALAMAATPAAGLVFVLSVSGAVAAGKRLLLPRVRPGVYACTSLFVWRKWMADRLMGLSLALTNTLYATLYALPWLRLLGARIGRRSEVSTVSHIDPDLLVLGSETFIADIASVGAATYHAGRVALGVTEIGDRTFVGNASVIRSRAKLPDNCLIGVQSVAPATMPVPGTSWLGSPAIFLPRRQVCDSFGENLTYRPSARLVAYRLFVEFWRVILPPSMLSAAGLLVARAMLMFPARISILVRMASMSAFYFGAAFATTLAVATMKWILVGRYRPRIEPLWAPFVRHSELITGLYESVTVPSLAHMLTGTPWIGPLLGLFGANVGRRVCLETTFATEFDLVRIGDDAAVGRFTSLQTHLFEDRVMKMSFVRVGAGATVGARAVVLYDSEIGTGASLDGLSLAMKGETIPAGTHWCGVPAQLVGS